MKEWKYTDLRTLVLPHIFKFDPINYTLKEIINPFDGVYKTTYENNNLDSKNSLFEDYMITKNRLIGTGSLLSSAINKGEWINFLDFEVPQYDANGLGELGWTFNSALGTYLISFIIMDTNGTPYIYEYKFKISSLEDFESSLKTNVYTLKELTYDEDGDLTDVYWVSNSSLSGGTMKCYPYDGLSNRRIFSN